MPLRTPSHRRPSTPGEIIVEEFLKPLDITQNALADRLGMTHARLSEIIRGRRGVSPDAALRLSRVLGPSPDFWLNLQQTVDLYDALHSDKAAEIEKLEPIKELCHG
jgi:antitoxin HigA-1